MIPKELDIAIPVAPKDLSKLTHCINGIVSNCSDRIRQIFVVCSQTSAREVCKQEVCKNGQVQVINEELFPFSKRQITSLMKSVIKGRVVFDNAGWYFQQLLKMYAFRVIPGLLENVLILDADFFFRKPITFFRESPELRILLAHGYPFDWERDKNIQRDFSLVKFAKRLLPEWDNVDAYSGIHHHCVFNKHILTSLLSEVETIHNEDFWIAYITNLDLSKWNAGSEYSIYYHYALLKFGHLIETRHLSSFDFVFDASSNTSIDAILAQTDKNPSISAVGFHNLVQMEKRFDPLNLTSSEEKSNGTHKAAYVYCIHLNNGDVGIIPWPNGG
jgi:hypothetical protein